MDQITQVALLTLRSAFRLKLAPALIAILAALSVIMPYIIRHNGTAQMFTQVTMSYSLSAISAVLGLATLWLACGSLARDITEKQIQILATKPIPRWKIWLGKWMGIILLDAILLFASGTMVVGMIMFRSSDLNKDQRKVLFEQVLVARSGVMEKTEYTDAEINAVVRYLEQNPRPGQSENEARLREEALSELKRRDQLIPNNRMRVWEIDLSHAASKLKDAPLFLRVHFYAAKVKRADGGTTPALRGFWEVGESPNQWRMENTITPDTYSYITVPAGHIGPDGILKVAFRNYNPNTLIFPLNDGLEVLYKEASFIPSFFRALGVLLCWMAALAALGLFSASFLSFPVASLLVFCMLLMLLSTSLMGEVVKEGTISSLDHETGQPTFTYLDWIMVPFFKTILNGLSLLKGFSPIEFLSSGRNVSWTILARAILQIVVLAGGILAFLGSLIFTRRELAAGQSQS